MPRPPTPGPWIKILFDQGLDQARTHLLDIATFAPFALAVDSRGKVRCLEPQRPPGPPESGPMYSVLVHELRGRREAGSVCAIAIMMDVKIRRESEAEGRTAVCLGLEDDAGYAEDVYVVYVLGEGLVNFSHPLAVPRRSRVFV